MHHLLDVYETLLSSFDQTTRLVTRQMYEKHPELYGDDVVEVSLFEDLDSYGLDPHIPQYHTVCGRVLFLYIKNGNWDITPGGIYSFLNERIDFMIPLAELLLVKSVVGDKFGFIVNETEFEKNPALYTVLETGVQVLEDGNRTAVINVNEYQKNRHLYEKLSVLRRCRYATGYENGI